MIANLNQIKDIILTNPNKALVQKGQEQNKLLRKHMYGEGLKESLKDIKGFTNSLIQEVRKEYTTSNRDLFARLGRPIDKVFSARGGSKSYNLSDSENGKAFALCNNVKDGFNATKWVEAYWKRHFLDDPNGGIFMEVGDDITYPTYKGSASIYDLEPTGSGVEYIVFHVSRKEKIRAGFKPEDQIYRFVDDAYDYYVKRTDKEVIILFSQSYPNHFGKVPFISNSDIISPLVEGYKESIYEDIIELAEKFLLTGSIKDISDLRHGFPKPWQYATDCSTCKGEGLHEGEVCTSCNGAGKMGMTKPNQALLLDMPESKDTPVIAPNVGGYIEPSKIYHEIAVWSREHLETKMDYTLWNRSNSPKTTGLGVDGDKTATQIVAESQPEISRLYPISESAEKRIKFIIDHKVSLEMRKPTYKGSSVNLGRSYMFETADDIWNRYVDAKKANAPIAILDDLLLDFIETKYAGDEEGKKIQMNLMYVEPFVHKDAGQLTALNVTPEDLAAKVYFSEWLATMSDAELFSMEPQELKQKLLEFAADKVYIPEPEEEVKPIGFGKN